MVEYDQVNTVYRSNLLLDVPVMQALAAASARHIVFDSFLFLAASLCFTQTLSSYLKLIVFILAFHSLARPPPQKEGDTGRTVAK
jgi:hypothetical protein